MVVEKEPFRLYDDSGKQKQDVIALRLNIEERTLLEKDKKLLNMDRDGTTIKALILAGRNVLHDPKIQPFFKIFLRIQKKGEEIDL